MSEFLKNHGPADFSEQLKQLSPQELFEQIEADNLILAQLGVKIPISEIIYGATHYGIRYEFAQYPSGLVRPTPLNCFMALIHMQPDLKKLSEADFENLAGTISHVSVSVESLASKMGSIKWPDKFSVNPQEILTK
jgi:hypothetical protein